MVDVMFMADIRESWGLCIIEELKLIEFIESTYFILYYSYYNMQ